MDWNPSLEAPTSEGRRTAGGDAAIWDRPSFEVIPLDCEITAYAPEGDGPLF